MKRFLLFVVALFALPTLLMAQGSTPNIGLQIPATGSNNWYIPLNYNFTKIDQLLSGNLAVPNFTVTGNITVGGTVTANAFVGVGGTGFALTPGANRYAVPYFSTPSPSSTIGGVVINGIPVYSTSAAPASATFANIVALWASGSCSGYLKNDGTCGGGSGNATQLQGYAIATTTPVNNAVPVWNSTNNSYSIAQLTLDQIAPAFNITGFSCSTCATYEVGFTVASPTNFGASYSSAPTSASITDGTNTVNLTTPFTSGSLAHSYTSSVVGTQNFTLTAIGATTKTAGNSITWLPRVFGGVGAASATSSVTASGNNAVLSTGATLTNAGLSNNNVGSVFGPYSPSGQKVYLLLIGGSHSFKDNSTGFGFAFNTPIAVTFVNQNGSTISMYLYESTNTLTGTFNVLVAN